jgi:hypothetical protein
MTSQNQIAAEDRRSSSGFLREQRLSAYHDLVKAHLDLVHLATDGDPADVGRDDLVDAYEEAVIAVVLLGSDPARRAAESMRREMLIWSQGGAVYAVRDGEPEALVLEPFTPVPDGGKTWTLSKDGLGRSGFDSMMEHYKEFLVAARRDLGGDEAIC